MDVCELGSKVATRGEVKQVKILGTIALIDEGMFLARVKLSFSLPPLLVSPFLCRSHPTSYHLHPPLFPLSSSLYLLGETDWKVLVIDVTDPLAPKMNGEGVMRVKGWGVRVKEWGVRV